MNAKFNPEAEVARLLKEHRDKIAALTLQLKESRQANHRKKRQLRQMQASFTNPRCWLCRFTVSEKFMKSMRAAKDHAKQQGLGRGNGGRGEMPCPAGCGGILRYSVASVNGHMHAACTTAECVRWME